MITIHLCTTHVRAASGFIVCVCILFSFIFAILHLQLSQKPLLNENCSIYSTFYFRCILMLCAIPLHCIIQLESIFENAFISIRYATVLFMRWRVFCVACCVCGLLGASAKCCRVSNAPYIIRCLSMPFCLPCLPVPVLVRCMAITPPNSLSLSLFLYVCVCLCFVSV